jgi:hypothetical protein
MDAYAQYRIKERLKYRRTPIKHHLIDASPLVSIYRETQDARHISKTIKRWETFGISIYEADEFCMKIGLHPIEVFGSTYFEGLCDEEEEYRKIYGELADV